MNTRIYMPTARRLEVALSTFFTLPLLSLLVVYGDFSLFKNERNANGYTE